MTEQQIDRDQPMTNHDRMNYWWRRATQVEAELDSWMARAYEAEGKLWKAEKRLAERMEHWNTTARAGAVDEMAAILEANARADQAEARIKAVQDVLDQADEMGEWAITCTRLQRAVDGSAPHPGA